MLIIIISVLIAFLYHLIRNRFKSYFVDIFIFSFVIISHLFYTYYFLPIDLLIGLSGANLLYTAFKKLKK